MLSFREVEVRYAERRALDRVSFDVAPGEIVGLLGPNGAGKSTAIAAATGLLGPDAGTVRINGADPKSPRARRPLGLVTQQIGLYEDLTVRQNIRLFASLQGCERRAINASMHRAIERVGLADRATDRVGRLSLGLKRRAHIAASLAHAPRLLVLDEPTAGLDPHARAAVLELVHQLAADGVAVLFTTQLFDEAERLCHRVLILHGGRIISERSARDEQLGELKAGELERLFMQLTANGSRSS